MKNFILIGFLALSAMACGEDTAPDDGAGNNGGAGLPAGVRFLHVHNAEPGTLDLVLRHSETQEEFRHDGVQLYSASGWTPIPAGIYTALFFRGGTSDVLAALSVQNLDVQEGVAKTIVAGQTAAGQARTSQLIDDITENTVPSENHGRLRFVHVAQGGPIDLYNDATSTRLATNIQNGAFAPYQELASTRYNLTAASEGLRDLVFATASELPVRPASVSTVYLVGNTDPDGDGDVSDSAASLIQIEDYVY